MGWLLLPALDLLSLVLAAGSLAHLARGAVRPGRFARDPRTRTDFGRTVYGAAWTSVIYCRPVLHAVLSCSPLRALCFRLFGYRGQLDFTTSPDTWLRDLPLLDLGAGAYLANRATLDTNTVEPNGHIRVDGIRIGARTVVGHLALVSQGVVLGDDVVVGVNAALGRKARVGDGAHFGARSNVALGTGVYVGRRARVAAGLRLAAGAHVPDRAQLRTQADADRCALRALAEPRSSSRPSRLHGPLTCAG